MVIDAVVEVERGRESYATEAWLDAYEVLSRADRVMPLGAADLELLATSAYMIGRGGDYFGVMERAQRAHLQAGEALAAFRCAFWIGINLARRGDVGRASGWLGRARRLLDGQGDDRVERGYLLLPVVFEREAKGELEDAAAIAGEAAAIGQRFGDSDLFALAAHEQGHILIQMGRISEGLRLLDETMVAVTSGELSPIVSGIAYCGVILACQDAYEVRRAQEWTAALSDWCERQPDLIAFTGSCLVHRAELMQLHGAWSQALQEARRARQRCEEGENSLAAGEASYRQGEIYRMLGDFNAAESAYREASQRGREPQPGLALLRLAQGRTDEAEASIRRVLSETAEASKRAGLLSACVEIMLAEGDLETARDACSELGSIAVGHENGVLGAMASRARGATALAEDNARGALVSLRSAGEVWRELEAPYEAARVRELVGLARQALGDRDGAALEFEAARAAYAQLMATPDLDRINSLTGITPADARGLTERELEVLRHLAAGYSNKAIADELVLSERTVERHVSNILTKLSVSSRAAAIAYTYEHRLLEDAWRKPPT